ncbi:Chitotriosidase-1 [Dactylella cylindrospora]|nr:Chitotriosidase-1 [Dactylella cylindrospora]
MSAGYRTVGYYVDWAIYGRNFKPQDLKADQFTHILFAFLKINRETGEITLADPWADVDIRWDQPWDQPGTNVYGIFYQLYRLKQTNRKLKVLLSIGGWTYSQNGDFAGGASTPERRDKFARSAVEMVKNYGLDGIDLDWEYPVDATEAANYVDLLRLCRQYLDEVNPSFELSVAAPCGPDKITKLDIPGMDKYLDFWNLMAYDFAGSWSSVSGHAANFYASTSNPGSTDFAFDDSLKLYSAVDPKKIVVGMPLYGRGFASTDGVGKPYSGSGAGHWEAGVWDYKDLPQAGAQVHEDTQLLASWSYDPNQRLMISYDTPNIARLKAQYIISKGLGGAMWWETSGDKVGADSLVQVVVDTFGGANGLDSKLNTIAYPQSKFDNIRSYKP